MSHAIAPRSIALAAIKHLGTAYALELLPCTLGILEASSTFYRPGMMFHTVSACRFIASSHRHPYSEYQSRESSCSSV